MKVAVFTDMCAGHFSDDFSFEKQLPTTSMESAKNFLEVVKILEWVGENNIRGILGWKFIKTNNDVGGHFYRRCLCLSVFLDDELALMRLTFDNEIEIIDMD